MLAPVLAAKPKTSQIEEKSFWDAKTWLAGDVGPANAFAERSRYHPRPLAEPGSPLAYQAAICCSCVPPLPAFIAAADSFRLASAG